MKFQSLLQQTIPSHCVITKHRSKEESADIFHKGTKLHHESRAQSLCLLKTLCWRLTQNRKLEAHRYSDHSNQSSRVVSIQASHLSLRRLLLCAKHPCIVISLFNHSCITSGGASDRITYLWICPREMPLTWSSECTLHCDPSLGRAGGHE